MPAAAVIPAPIAYIKVVAVKKLVVEPWDSAWGLSNDCTPKQISVCGPLLFALHWVSRSPMSYCEKIRVFKAGQRRLNTLAWNN